MAKKGLAYVLAVLLVATGGFLAYRHFYRPAPPPQAENRYQRGHNIPGKLYWAGSAQDKMVALTFDDGPEDYWTPRVLDVLKAKQVKATFFVIGRQADKFPTMLRRIDAEGHIVGDHTYNHVDLTRVTTEQAAAELDKCATTIQKIIGRTPRLVRPPFGFHNQAVDDLIYLRQRVIVLWSLDTEDWTGVDAAAVRARVVPKMANGFIVLQHDGENPKLGGSLQALPAMIDELKAKGYSFVTIPDLLAIEPYL